MEIFNEEGKKIQKQTSGGNIGSIMPKANVFDGLSKNELKKSDIAVQPIEEKNTVTSIEARKKNKDEEVKNLKNTVNTLQKELDAMKEAIGLEENPDKKGLLNKFKKAIEYFGSKGEDVESIEDMLKDAQAAYDDMAKKRAALEKFKKGLEVKQSENETKDQKEDVGEKKGLIGSFLNWGADKIKSTVQIVKDTASDFLSQNNFGENVDVAREALKSAESRLETCLRAVSDAEETLATFKETAKNSAVAAAKDELKQLEENLKDAQSRTKAAKEIYKSKNKELGGKEFDENELTAANEAWRTALENRNKADQAQKEADSAYTNNSTALQRTKEGKIRAKAVMNEAKKNNKETFMGFGLPFEVSVDDARVAWEQAKKELEVEEAKRDLPNMEKKLKEAKNKKNSAGRVDPRLEQSIKSQEKNIEEKKKFIKDNEKGLFSKALSFMKSPEKVLKEKEEEESKRKEIYDKAVEAQQAKEKFERLTKKCEELSGKEKKLENNKALAQENYERLSAVADEKQKKYNDLLESKREYEKLAAEVDELSSKYEEAMQAEIGVRNNISEKEAYIESLENGTTEITSDDIQAKEDSLSAKRGELDVAKVGLQSALDTLMQAIDTELEILNNQAEAKQTSINSIINDKIKGKEEALNAKKQELETEQKNLADIEKELAEVNESLWKKRIDAVKDKVATVANVVKTTATNAVGATKDLAGKAVETAIVGTLNLATKGFEGVGNLIDKTQELGQELGQAVKAVTPVVSHVVESTKNFASKTGKTIKTVAMNTAVKGLEVAGSVLDNVQEVKKYSGLIDRALETEGIQEIIKDPADLIDTAKLFMFDDWKKGAINKSESDVNDRISTNIKSEDDKGRIGSVERKRKAQKKETANGNEMEESLKRTADVMQWFNTCRDTLANLQFKDMLSVVQGLYRIKSKYDLEKQITDLEQIKGVNRAQNKEIKKSIKVLKDLSKVLKLVQIPNENDQSAEGEESVEISKMIFPAASLLFKIPKANKINISLLTKGSAEDGSDEVKKEPNAESQKDILESGASEFFQKIKELGKGAVGSTKKAIKDKNFGTLFSSGWNKIKTGFIDFVKSEQGGNFAGLLTKETINKVAEYKKSGKKSEKKSENEETFNMIKSVKSLFEWLGGTWEMEAISDKFLVDILGYILPTLRTDKSVLDRKIKTLNNTKKTLKKDRSQKNEEKIRVIDESIDMLKFVKNLGKFRKNITNRGVFSAIPAALSTFKLFNKIQKTTQTQGGLDDDKESESTADDVTVGKKSPKGITKFYETLKSILIDTDNNDPKETEA